MAVKVPKVLKVAGLTVTLLTVKVDTKHAVDHQVKRERNIQHADQPLVLVRKEAKESLGVRKPKKEKKDE